MNAWYFPQPMIPRLPARVRRLARATRFSLALTLALTCLVGVSSGVSAILNTVQFDLAPNTKFQPCFSAQTGTPTAHVTVTRGAVNDTLEIVLSHFKPDLDFDMFTVQNSMFLATGAKDPGFTNVGLAWYQSDIQSDSSGNADVTINRWR